MKGIIPAGWIGRALPGDVQPFREGRLILCKPFTGQFLVGPDCFSGLEVFGQQSGVFGIKESPAVKKDPGPVFGGTDKAPEGLADAAHTWNQVEGTEGQAGGPVSRFKGPLAPVDLGEGGTDDNGPADFSAEGVDPLAETASKDEEEDISGEEGGIEEGMLFLKGQVAGLKLAAQAGIEEGHPFEDLTGIAVTREKDYAASRRGEGGLADGMGGRLEMELALAVAGINAGIRDDLETGVEPLAFPKEFLPVPRSV